MNDVWISKLGNWNPQLLRELRGRLNSRSIIAAIALSIIFQGILLLITQDQFNRDDNWIDLWNALTWSIPYLLFTIGSFYIVSDLVQEEKTGTLNFIRLSPRPAWQILLGKLIGVPVLPLLAIALLIPLHLISGFLGAVPLPLILSFYLVLAVGCALCWSLALLFGFFGSSRSGLAGQANSLAIAYTALSLFIYAPLFMAWNISITWRGIEKPKDLLSDGVRTIHWYWIPINDNLFIAHAFTLINLIIFIAIAWRILLRRFRRPLSPLFSRRQSYGICAYLITLVIGSTLFPTNRADYYSSFIFGIFSEIGVVFVLIFAYFIALTLMVGICPQRQALAEWSRIKSSGLMGYIWSDKSPAIISFGIILVIMNGLLLPWMLAGNLEIPVEAYGLNNRVASLIVLAGINSTIFMIGCLLQWVMSIKLRNPGIWFSGSLLLWWTVPPIILSILDLKPDDFAIASTIWTFCGYPVGHLEEPNNILFVMIGILGQWIVSAFLLWKLKESLAQISQMSLTPNSR